VVTGKPVSLGGSEGRLEATGRGIQYLLEEHLRAQGGLRGKTVAVQGFGNVGSVAAKLLRDEGAKIVAISDSSGGVYAEDGLDIDAIIAMPRTSLPLDTPGRRITNAELLELPVDILVPAATEGQIHAGNAGRIRAKMVIEAANGPTTAEGDRILNARGVFVVPDIVANAGGVIVSYFEWVQDLQSFFWEESEVNARLERIIKRSFQEVAAIQAKESCTMREAAYVLAVSRVVEATQVRGIFP
jgi:glutamate dehydrogenase (NAD(P)+)